MAIVRFDTNESPDLHDHACDSCGVVITEDCEDAIHLIPDLNPQLATDVEAELCDACEVTKELEDEEDDYEGEVLPENQ